jgi:hypothetical protein
LSQPSAKAGSASVETAVAMRIERSVMSGLPEAFFVLSPSRETRRGLVHKARAAVFPQVCGGA